MKTQKEFDLVMRLKKDGSNNSKISRTTGISRSTVVDWIYRPPKHFTGKPCNYSSNVDLKGQIISDKTKHEAYSYLLGLYLGDGYINKKIRSYMIRFSLDKKYKKLNDFTKEMLKIIFPDNTIGIIDFKNHIDLSIHNINLPSIFPQHGKGMKYTRKVVLTEWQKNILIDEHFLKGLIYSDGCFFIRNVGKYSYNACCFTNKSVDIQRLFQGICDKFSIEWKYSKRKTGVYDTNVQKQEAFNRIVELIGTKENPKQ